MGDKILTSFIQPQAVYQRDLASLLWSKLDQFKEKVALVDSSTGASLTYTDLKESAECIAGHLMELGLKPRDVVTFYSTNCLEYIVVMFAVWRVGGITSLLNAMAVSKDVTREIERTNSSILFTNDANVKNALSGAANAKLKTIISTGSHAGCLSYPALLKNPTLRPLPSIDGLKIDPVEDVVAILFSSGTTGLPKAVQITHRNMNNALSLVNHPAIRFCGPQNVIFQPMAHIYGSAMVVVSVSDGATTMLMPKFSLDGYLQLVEKQRVDTLHLVPPVAVLMAKSGLIQKFDLSCVKQIICGAAPLSHDVEEEINQQMGGNIHFRQAYGMTESTGISHNVVALSHIHHFKPQKPGSIGILCPTFEAKVISEDNGIALGSNEIGELCFRSPSVMKGYLGDAGATAASIDKDDWLHSGDIGYYDENQCFYVVDRLKELIKYNALQVAPSELEALILTHPAVADVGVVGKPDPVAGELPMAWVVVKPGKKLTEQEMMDFVAEKVAPYKKLRGGVKFVDMIPKSPSGKILRKDIKLALRNEMTKSKL